MRPAYLPKPGVWLRTPATLTETPAQRACAIEHAQRLDRAARWPEHTLYLIAAGLLAAWLWSIT
jgi:hypothetical protein